MKTPRARGRFWRRCSLLLLVSAAVAVPATAEYRTVELESLRITIDSDWVARTTPGYLPVRFDITNLGDARVIEITAQGTRSFRVPRSAPQSGALDLRQTVRLARGDRVRLTIPVPVIGDHENIRFEVREDGRTLERFSYTGVPSRMVARDASVLIVADPASPFGSAATTWARSLASARGTGSRTMVVVSPPGAPIPVAPSSRGPGPMLDFVLHPERLPTNWLGFTSVRAVVIGPGEWAQLNEGQKTALLTWTACGGDLIGVDANADALIGGQSRAPSGPGESVRAYFFGRIHVPSLATMEATGIAGALSAADAARSVHWSLPANGALDWGVIAARGFRLPIPGINGVPARIYLGLLLLFSVLIGPVNYWWLRRRRQQVLVVLTAPIISALFIVLLGGYVIAGEGFGVHGRAVTFTMLDQARRQASTRASVSLYAAGMTPSSGLRFARDTAVFPIGADGTGVRGRQALDLSDAQSFSSGLLQARAPANLEVIGLRPARERLNVSEGPEGVRVVNGLDATILALVYRTDDRTYSLTSALPAGAQAALAPGPAAAQLTLPADAGLVAKFTPLVANQPHGSYLAILERSPFWDSGVTDLAERGSFHLVLGWPEGQP